MNKQDFVDKWSNFWAFQKNPKELTGAFEKELNELTKPISEIENLMERWHLGRDNDLETILAINEVLVSIGLLSFFNDKK